MGLLPVLVVLWNLLVLWRLKRTKGIIVPFRLAAIRHEIGCYATWYNEFRPHTGLGGCTPLEVFGGLPPANREPRFEPRSRWPRKARCAAPNLPMKGRAGGRLRLVLSRFENRAHLPVVELRRAA